jgi:hypothetical protein
MVRYNECLAGDQLHLKNRDCDTVGSRTALQRSSTIKSIVMGKPEIGGIAPDFRSVLFTKLKVLRSLQTAEQ